MTARKPKYAQEKPKKSDDKPTPEADTKPNDPESLDYSELKPKGEAHDRQSWVINYSNPAGVIATIGGAAGVMFMGYPLIYIVLVPTMIVVAWATGVTGGRFSELIKGAKIGNRWAALWLILTVAVGLVTWLLIGPIIGSLLMSLGNVHFVLRLIIVVALFFAASILILGVVDHKKLTAIVGLVLFAAAVSFGVNFGTVEAETQQRQQEHFEQERENQKKLDDTCSSEEAELYPAECGG